MNRLERVQAGLMQRDALRGVSEETTGSYGVSTR